MTKTPAKRAKFTDSELALIAQRREEWLAVGRSSQPADRATAEAALTKMYGVLKLPRPIFIWGRSPIESLYFGVMVKALIDNGDNGSLKVNGGQLYGQLYGQLGGQLYDQLYDQHSRTWHWGAHESAWVAFYEVGKELGVTYTDQLVERLDWHRALCRSALWVQSFSGICFVSERPTHQTVDDQGRLHHETGPAMRFGDDYRLYAWHGIRVAAEVIETPATQLTVARINAETNQEVRRVLLERMGWWRYLRESGATATAQDVYGKLYRLPLDGDRSLAIVEVVNGTPEPLKGDYSEDAGYVKKGRRWFKKYFLRVPSTMTTAHQAVAWTYFEIPETYAPLTRT